jgi:sn-glycerol 3-phosphate transport system substrate-binding protein
MNTSTAPKRRPGPARLIAVVLGMALVAAACGSDDGGTEGASGGNGGADGSACPVGAHLDAEGRTEVTIWHGWVGLTKRTIESIVDEYNASQDAVTVRAEAQGNYEEMLAKFETAVGDPATLPDVIASEDTTLRFMVDSGMVVPAQACIDADDDAQDFYEDMLPAVTAAYTVEDTLWPASFNVSAPVLYANLSHLQQAGLPAAELPQTLDDMRAYAEAIRDAGIEGVQEPLVARLDSWYVEHLLTGSQEPIVDADNGRSGVAENSEFDNETTREIYAWFKSMYDDGLMKAIPYSDAYGQLFAMALGQSSILIDTSTAITSVNGAIEGTLTNEELGAEDLDFDLSNIQLDDLEIGVGLNPGFEAAGRGQIGGGAWFMVDRGDDAVTAATWDFMKFFNETQQQVRWTLDGSYLPASESARQDPELLEEFESTRRGRWLAVAADSLEQLDPEFPGPVIGPYNQLRASVRNSLEELTLAGGDPDEIISQVDSRLQSDLDSYAREVG